MRKAVKLRTLTAEEETAIHRLAASRKATHRLVQRAQVIVAMLGDPKLPATHAGFRAGFWGAQSGVDWVKRAGGLEDKPKAGRPLTHDQKVRSESINLALQKPDSLGYRLPAEMSAWCEPSGRRSKSSFCRSTLVGSIWLSRGGSS